MKLYKEINLIKLYGNSHYITPRPTVEKAIKEIKKELITYQLILQKRMTGQACLATFKRKS